MPSNYTLILLTNPIFQIYSSGFPKKACRGCHISEGARRIIFILVAFNALGSKSMETNVKSVANQTQGFFLSRHFVGGGAVERRKTAVQRQHRPHWPPSLLPSLSLSLDCRGPADSDPSPLSVLLISRCLPLFLFYVCRSSFASCHDGHTLPASKQSI